MKNMIWNTFKSSLAIAMLSFTMTAPAEDIDLFMGAVPSTSTEIPNVLIVIDNTSNWSAAFTAEMSALAATVNSLDPNKIRLGFMMYTETNNPAGAYVRAAVRTMTADNKATYLALVNSFNSNDDKSSNSSSITPALAMSEAHRYFSGIAAYAGANQLKRDHKDNTSGTAASNAVYALADNAFRLSEPTTYVSPALTACQKNFVIYLSNGKTNSGGNSDLVPRAQLETAGGDTTTPILLLSDDGYEQNMADDWSRYLATRSATKVITYTIDIVPTSPGQYSLGYKALLQSMATQGKGKYFNVGSADAADVGDKIKEALGRIFAEIQAVNSVYASASLPVSVNTQGTYLNQVFIGMFRPDASTAPRWTGNLKQYKFKASVSGSGFALNLVDADDALAINYNTGFITQCARSFWTPTIVDSYWNYANSKAEGSCSAATIWSDTPDGDVVEKGGAGYGLRQATTARIVKTCAGTCTDTILPTFDTTISPSAFGLGTDTTARNALVNWTIGRDNLDENGIGDNVTERRPSIHGDVVHSRPVAIDYGVSTSVGGYSGVVVYYGANDGMLHAVNGNQTGTGAGQELWAFVAPDQYSRLTRIRDNSLLIPFPSAGGDKVKPYFFDGPVTGHQDGGTVYIYATQRRGGRMFYAFDVSTPASPSLKWRKGCTTPLGDDTGCQADYTGMGQTWSAPKVIKAAGYVSGTVKLPLLIMGGGYDTCEDVDNGTTNNTCISPPLTRLPKGNKVYVLDANSGVVLRTFDAIRSVVADVTVVPNASTGLAEYAYVADTGGNVYRITMGNAAPADWPPMVKIAALGCDAPPCTSGGVKNRKFLFAPEVVVTPDFNAVLVGSGDREHPLSSHVATKTVANAFFMLKDKPSNAAWLSDESTSTKCNEGVLCLNSLLAISNTGANPSQSDLDAKKGWYLTLSSTEQVVTSAVTLFGEVTFSTHMPAVPIPGSCGSNLGTAQVYNIRYLNAGVVGGSSARFAQSKGGGLAPSPVSGLVTVTNPTTGGPMTVPFIIGANPDSPVEAKLKLSGSGTLANKQRVYWYIQQ